jgi:hypothetical protein
MNPAYWIGILAVTGAVLSYVLFRWTGWFDSGIGTAVGILIGVIIYVRLKEKQKHG